MSKRTLDSFFAPPAKKPRPDQTTAANVSPSPTSLQTSNHDTYPWPLPHFPPHIAEEIEGLVTAEGKAINHQPHLDLLYFQPFVPQGIQRELFQFLRSELFFYRVKYSTKKFGKEILINTPRYTTVFGLDQTSRFTRPSPADDSSSTSDQGTVITEFSTNPGQEANKPIHKNKYKCKPRPIPQCLDLLRRVTEANTNTEYNFCLVNYYATGSDSISFHSDDEWFLGPNPAIASFSLGARRDFLMKHKPPKPNHKLEGEGLLSSAEIKAVNDESMPTSKPVKLSLASGDMVLMRGPTQSNWLHSIPKRTGGEADGGRINITFRRAMVPAGTENYYRYNVGDGGVFKWDKSKREMLPWPSPG